MPLEWTTQIEILNFNVAFLVKSFVGFYQGNGIFLEIIWKWKFEYFFAKLFGNFSKFSISQRKKTMLLMSKFILKCNYKFVIYYTMNIFHNIISQNVTKWNSNTNPMKKFIFHAIHNTQIHQIFDITKFKKQNPPEFTSLQK